MAGGGSSLLGLALASRTYSLGRQVKQCDVWKEATGRSFLQNTER